MILTLLRFLHRKDKEETSFSQCSAVQAVVGWTLGGCWGVALPLFFFPFFLSKFLPSSQPLLPISSLHVDIFPRVHHGERGGNLFRDGLTVMMMCGVWRAKSRAKAMQERSARNEEERLLVGVHTDGCDKCSGYMHTHIHYPTYLPT